MSAPSNIREIERSGPSQWNLTLTGTLHDLAWQNSADGEWLIAQLNDGTGDISTSFCPALLNSARGLLNDGSLVTVTGMAEKHDFGFTDFVASEVAR